MTTTTAEQAKRMEKTLDDVLSGISLLETWSRGIENKQFVVDICNARRCLAGLTQFDSNKVKEIIAGVLDDESGADLDYMLDQAVEKIQRSLNMKAV